MTEVRAVSNFKPREEAMVNFDYQLSWVEKHLEDL